MNVCQNDPIGGLLYQTIMALRNYLEIRPKPLDLTAGQCYVL
jgi:hypothetical protein